MEHPCRDFPTLLRNVRDKFRGLHKPAASRGQRVRAAPCLVPQLRQPCGLPPLAVEPVCRLNRNSHPAAGLPGRCSGTFGFHGPMPKPRLVSLRWLRSPSVSLPVARPAKAVPALCRRLSKKAQINIMVKFQYFAIPL